MITTNQDSKQATDQMVGRHIGAVVAATEALSMLAGARNFWNRVMQYVWRGDLSRLMRERDKQSSRARWRNRAAAAVLIARIDQHVADLADLCDQQIGMTDTMRAAVSLGAAKEKLALIALDLPSECFEERPYSDLDFDDC